MIISIKEWKRQMKTRLLYEPLRPPRAAFGIASNATCVLLPISQVTSLKDLHTPHSFFLFHLTIWNPLENYRRADTDMKNRLALADRKVKEEERNNKLNSSYFLCYILQQCSSRQDFQTLKTFFFIFSQKKHSTRPYQEEKTAILQVASSYPFKCCV